MKEAGRKKTKADIKSPDCRDIFKKYAENTAIAGPAYTVDKSITEDGRTFSVFSALFLVAQWSDREYRNWEEWPVLNDIRTTGKSVMEVPFPAITVCPQGMVYRAQHCDNTTQ